MLLLFSNSLVLVGTIFLIGSLVTVRKITRRLPLGSSRTSWHAMAALISLFVIGYLGYMIVFWNKQASLLEHRMINASRIPLALRANVCTSQPGRYDYRSPAGA